ncbi:hypothetical protein LAWI1_G008452 [Lachnellula willkommii]|uniref:Uncharacterized protein n=1 Tax=Lachnellula willkommii TaxID=215461 RepID=A0A559LYR0_9HELO|nr:hypothetical protein LAWI1_G008452 [Lachnellula willkommii]
MIRHTIRRRIPRIRAMRVANQKRGVADISPGGQESGEGKVGDKNPSETSSTQSTTANATVDAEESSEEGREVPEKKKRQGMAELDEELRAKLDGISGEGGGAGVQYEGGKAVGLKRGVRENMFRVI